MPDGDFLAKPLATLGAIYRFVGGLSANSRVDVRSPIVLVHDVSSEAERGASLMVNVTHSITTGGAGAKAFTTIEVADLFSGVLPSAAAQLAAIGRTPQNTDVYLMALEAHITAVTAANVLNVVAGARPPDDARYVSTAGQTPRFLYRAVTEIADSEVTAGGQLALLGGGNGAKHFVVAPLPMRVATLFFQTQDDAVGPITVTFDEVFAFVPINSAPPRAA